MPRRPTLPLAALAAAAALLAAGCGDDGSSDAPSTTAPVMTAPITPVTVTAGTPITVTAPVTTAPATTAPPVTTPGGSDEEAVRAAIQGYITAFLGGDGATACALLTPASQAKFVADANAQGLPGSDCATLFGQIAAQVPEATKDLVRAATVGPVTVTGNTASGTVTVAGQQSPFTAERAADGRWLLAEALG